jgi:hypothetical protein
MVGKVCLTGPRLSGINRRNDLQGVPGYGMYEEDGVGLYVLNVILSDLTEPSVKKERER